MGPDSSAGGAAPRQEQSPDQKQQSPLWGAKGDFQPSVLKESTGREELEPSSGLQESEGCLFGSVMPKEQTGHFLSSPGHCPRNGKQCRGTAIHNPPGAGQATKHSTAGMWTPRVPPCRAASSLSRQEGLSPRCHCRGRRMQRRRESMRGRRQFRRLAAAERRPGTLPC